MTRLVLLLVFLTSVLNAEVKVKTKTKGLLIAHKVEYKSGKLNIYTEKDSKFTIKLNIEDVVSIDQREPSQAELLKKYYLEGKHKLIANDKGVKVLEANFGTGWGKKSAFYLAMSFIKGKQFKKAEGVIKTARIHLPGLNDKEDTLLLKLAESYLHFERGNPKFLLSDLQKVSVPQSALGKMFYYQLQGRLLELNEKSGEAVLSYYKGIMLGVKSQERVHIQERILAIYKTQNDPRSLPNLNNI